MAPKTEAPILSGLDRKALLETRLRRLKSLAGGLESLAEDSDSHAAEIAALDEEYEQAKSDLRASRATLAAANRRRACSASSVIRLPAPRSTPAVYEPASRGSFAA